MVKKYIKNKQPLLCITRTSQRIKHNLLLPNEISRLRYFFFLGTSAYDHVAIAEELAQEVAVLGTYALVEMELRDPQLRALHVPHLSVELHRQDPPIEELLLVRFRHSYTKMTVKKKKQF